MNYLHVDGQTIGNLIFATLRHDQKSREIHYRHNSFSNGCNQHGYVKCRKLYSEIPSQATVSSRYAFSPYIYEFGGSKKGLCRQGKRGYCLRPNHYSSSSACKSLQKGFSGANSFSAVLLQPKYPYHAAYSI